MTIKEMLHNILTGNASIDDIFNLVFSVFLIATMFVVFFVFVSGMVYLGIQMILDL